jgi:hypothetical protein
MDADKEKLLRDIYYDAARGLGGKQALWRRVQREHPGEFRKAAVMAWVDKQALAQVNTKARSRFRGFFRIVAPPRTFQVDVLHLSRASVGANKDMPMMLIAVDVLSRYMVVVPIKRRAAGMLVTALDALLDKVGRIVGIEGDDEFSAAAVRTWAERHNVLVSTDVARDDHHSAGDRLGVVDAAVRTLKRRIRNFQVANDQLRVGAPALQELVRGYNSADHSALRGKTPEEVWGDEVEQAKLHSRATDHNLALREEVALEVGERVRVRVDRGAFDKEKPTFSSSVYVVDEVDGNKYRVRGEDDGKMARRRYKYFELLPVRGDVQGTAAGAGRLAAAAARASKRRVVARALKELA